MHDVVVTENGHFVEDFIALVGFSQRKRTTVAYS